MGRRLRRVAQHRAPPQRHPLRHVRRRHDGREKDVLPNPCTPLRKSAPEAPEPLVRCDAQLEAGSGCLPEAEPPSEAASPTRRRHSPSRKGDIYDLLCHSPLSPIHREHPLVERFVPASPHRHRALLADPDAIRVLPYWAHATGTSTSRRSTGLRPRLVSTSASSSCRSDTRRSRRLPNERRRRAERASTRGRRRPPRERGFHQIPTSRTTRLS